MKKRALAFLIALVMVFTLLPMSALADKVIDPEQFLADKQNGGYMTVNKLNGYNLITSADDKTINAVIPYFTSKNEDVAIYGVDSYAFNYNVVLTSFKTESSLFRTLRPYAFSNANGLSSVDLAGSGVEVIPEGCFSDCDKLKEVKLPNDLRTIEIGAFADSGITKLEIPSNVYSIAPSAFNNCKSLAYFKITGANLNYKTENGVLYSADMTELVKFPPAVTGTFKVPETVTKIGEHAFSSSSLSEIILPSGLKEIGAKAFYNAQKLEKLAIPEGVEYLPEDMCYGCKELKEVIIPASATKAYHNWSGDWGEQFKGCYAMEKMTFRGGEEQRVALHILIPSSNVQIIYDSAPKTAAPVVTSGNNAATGKITLKWQPVEGAAKYKILRAGTKNGEYKYMWTTENTSYTNTSAYAGYTYYYKVIAIDENGYDGAESNIVSRTCDCAKPKVKASNDAKTGKVRLTWDKVQGAGKYEIYRWNSTKKKYERMYTTTSTSYTNTSAYAGYTYYYKVKAISSRTSYADSAMSAEITRACNPAKPVVGITTSSGKPKLEWKRVDGAIKYYIYRSTSKNGTYQHIATSQNTSYTNGSAMKGYTYYYKIVAVSARTDSVKSAYSDVVYIKATK